MSKRLTGINFNHSLIFFLSSIIISLIIFKTNQLIISPTICLLLILTIGVSHGSLDHIKGKKLLKILNIKKMYIFYLTYVLLATLVVIIWTLTPSLSLIIFLSLLSVYKTYFLTHLLFSLSLQIILLLYQAQKPYVG